MKMFFEKLRTPFETIPFSQINEGEYLEDLDKAIDLAKSRIAEIKKVTSFDFQSIIVPLMECDKELGLISSTFFNLYGSNMNEKTQEIAKDFSPKLTKFYNDVSLDGDLFDLVKRVHDSKDSLGLTTEEMTILEKEYKGFVRNGALLSEADKEKIRKIDEEKSKTSLAFGDNALAAKNDYYLPLSESDVAGLPESFLDASRAAAKNRGIEGKFVVEFDPTLYLPFMTYSARRDLREKVYRDRSVMAVDGNHSNQSNILKLLKLREERANILGYATHAEFVLEERMAKNPGTVIHFIEDILDKAGSVAKKEVQEVAEMAKEKDGIEKLEAWDWSYYSELLKKKKFNFDDEILRPYFKLENVIEGAFEVATKLFDLKFKVNNEIDRYHEDVIAYEVYEGSASEPMGIFYADFFPRSSKRAGAWMTDFKSQSKTQIPHVLIVCNFTKSTETKPSLLTLNEVLTLFHEFGHSLHGLLSKCEYKAVAGTNVYWDFVELPSQILENWVYEKECLDMFAKHYKSGELIPNELIKKIKDSRKFLEGYATMRQLSFASLDMHLHTKPSKEITDIVAEEEAVMNKFRLFPNSVERACMSCSFGHIFNGGYSAGYYSYKWAEVLDADAFEKFQQDGIFNKETAKVFKDEILSKGGSEHPETLYKRFKGEKPKPDALLRRAGLL